MVPPMKYMKILSWYAIEYPLEGLLEIGKGRGGWTNWIFGDKRRRFVELIPNEFVKKNLLHHSTFLLIKYIYEHFNDFVSKITVFDQNNELKF